MARILIVDDEQDICEILKFHLEDCGYQADTASSAEEALELDIASYDLLLLDVMMDKMSGFSLASQLKRNEATAHIPIIFVTAKDTENDMLHGFNIGADDYISKPFHLSEVSARVKAVLRRSTVAENPAETKHDSSQDILTYRDLTVDTTDKTVSLYGEKMILTRKEYELLLFLMRNRGHIFGRDQLLDNVWSDDANVLERSVDVTIFRLRKKLKDYADTIVSRSGYGYGFKE
jgi:two-component system, OmpR family, alkaline phosphatase synthesis response regulator PhoP